MTGESDLAFVRRVSARELEASDPYLYAEALPDVDLARLRELAVRTEPNQKIRAVVAAVGFTCDGCRIRARCAFAFDTYNTEGDCLLDK